MFGKSRFSLKFVFGREMTTYGKWPETGLGQFGTVIKFDNHMTSQHGAIPELGEFSEHSRNIR